MKLFLSILIVATLTACAPTKPELANTQKINGKSIVLPPEYDVLP